ncbi:hypothetical protein llap_22315 [Limosa lapponica baueri]|uniref:Uncharacterized protein n=1 Tax=Limosa lapponica baueri TaxID=1758121 RepID=A0A2I0T0Q4_LIMLA|nr:hypothetical protein llap_22315 [Limosa lapponica baueri]
MAPHVPMVHPPAMMFLHMAPCVLMAPHVPMVSPQPHVSPCVPMAPCVLMAPHSPRVSLHVSHVPSPLPPCPAMGPGHE